MSREISEQKSDVKSENVTETMGAFKGVLISKHEEITQPIIETYSSYSGSTMEDAARKAYEQAKKETK